MILAAGMGTRLMPLTRDIPKALIAIKGRPLLKLAIQKLRADGFGEIIVNVHHHSELVKEFLDTDEYRDIAISDESSALLDTGGGIRKAQWFLDGKDPFVVYNVDVITDLDLQDLYRAHLSFGSLATLAVTRRNSSRYFLFDHESKLCGWKSARDGRIKWCGPPIDDAKEFAFSGIHMINPEIFRLMDESGSFSIVNTYLRLGSEHPIRAFDHTGSLWFDLGKADQLPLIESKIMNLPGFQTS